MQVCVTVALMIYIAREEPVFLVIQLGLCTLELGCFVVIIMQGRLKSLPVENHWRKLWVKLTPGTCMILAVTTSFAMFFGIWEAIEL